MSAVRDITPRLRTGNAPLPLTERSRSQLSTESPERQVLGTHALVAAVEAGICLLDDGRRISLAASCLLQPCVGDRVLVTDSPAYVLAVLERSPDADAVLNVPGADKLRVTQRRIALECSEELALRSLKDAELTAATGTLSVQARNLFTTVLESLIERAADRIARFGNSALDVAGLMRMRSRQGIVTADKELRLDADQMHLG